jgi:hypothetical protein
MGLVMSNKLVLAKEATLESCSDRHCQGSTLMPLTAEAVGAIGPALSNHN